MPQKGLQKICGPDSLIKFRRQSYTFILKVKSLQTPNKPHIRHRFCKDVCFTGFCNYYFFGFCYCRHLHPSHPDKLETGTCSYFNCTGYWRNFFYCTEEGQSFV